MVTIIQSKEVMRKNLLELLDETVRNHSDSPFLLEENEGEYNALTYSEVRGKAMSFGAGLISLGIKKGDRIALLSEGKSRWIISELGVFYAGAISVPLSIKLQTEKDLSFRINHSGCVAIVISKEQLEKIKNFKEKFATVKFFIVLDNIPLYEQNEINFNTIIAQGERYLEANRVVFSQHIKTINPDDIANISYTSGTTANPKGIMLSHHNYVCNAEQAVAHIGGLPSYFRTLLILPWDHAFGHSVGVFAFMKAGASVASVTVGKSVMETLRNIPRNLGQINPHILLSVPSLAANFRKSIEAGVKKQGKLSKILFERGLKITYKYNKEGYNKGSGGSMFLKPLVWLFDRLIFSKIRKSFSSNLEYFIGGGALLDIELQRFFYAIGIPMYQGYGLSEASPVISANTPAQHKLGSSGKPMPYMEIRIVDEDGKECERGRQGEIIIKGGNVMLGYWQNEEATRNTIVNDWLHTGDLGYLDTDGYLYVLGRRKSLLISSDGEKFSPEGIEEALTANSQFIEQAVLYNNQKPYTIALLVPNRAYLRKKTSEPEQALQLLAEEIEKYKGRGEFSNLFPERWIPSAFAVLDTSFTEENGMINSTMKVVRHKVYCNNQQRIDDLYTATGKGFLSDKNVESMKKIIK